MRSPKYLFQVGWKLDAAPIKCTPWGKYVPCSSDSLYLSIWYLCDFLGTLSSFFCDKGVQKQQLSRILASFDRLGNKQKHPLFLHLLMEEKQVEDEVQEEEYVLVEGDAEKY